MKGLVKANAMEIKALKVTKYVRFYYNLVSCQKAGGGVMWFVCYILHICQHSATQSTSSRNVLTGEGVSDRSVKLSAGLCEGGKPCEYKVLKFILCQKK